MTRLHGSSENLMNRVQVRVCGGPRSCGVGREGEKDGWLDPSLAPRLRKEIPGSELKLIQEGGHFVQEDAPEEIAKARPPKAQSTL